MRKLTKNTLLLITSILLVSCNNNKLFQENINLNDTQVNTYSKNIEKPEVIDLLSPNQNERPENTVISAVILHHTATASDAEKVGRFFQNPKSGVSSHYIVDRTGYIVQSVPDSERSWHAGVSEFNGKPNVNDFSIGIEICNLGNSIEPYPDEQYDAIIKLVGYLVKKYNIPLTGITRHRDIAIPPGRKIDTSNNFSVQRVLDGVSELLNNEYRPIQKDPYKQIKYPEFISIKTKKGQNSLKMLSDIYLDNENRWKELELVNPNIKNPNNISEGTTIKIPTSFEYFYKTL